MERHRSWRDSWCIFLDVDGTLLELAETPEAVTVGADLVGVLGRASTALGGALALISGRPIAALDRLFAPLQLPTAGVHGLERRNALGAYTEGPVDWLPLGTARHAMAELARRHRGLTLEDKGLAVALHWRREPQLEESVRSLLGSLAARLGPDFELQEGDAVLEIKATGRDKGTAVESFLREAPFAGRVPLYVGDDATDAAAFRAVERHGGWAIGVGPRPDTLLRFADPLAVRRWLGRLTGPSGLLGAT
jgi:trehalose 6-phosphate phosphatase